MAATFAFVALLTYGNPYVMSLVVDRVSADPVPADKVFEAFLRRILLRLLQLMFSDRLQASYKIYTIYKLEIAAAYDLATMSFDALL